MKVLVIAPNSLRYCPYAFFYIKLLRANAIDFDVVYADRYQLKEQFDFSAISFPWDPAKSRISQFLAYRKFLSRIAKRDQYDKVIVLTTLMAVLVNDILIKRFKNNYIVDVRDFTYENIFLYRVFEKKAIQNSSATLISSSRFTDFLPAFDYVPIYNVPDVLDSDSTFEKKSRGEVITIGYVGSIAYRSQCEKLLRLVERDDRFRFALHGNDMSGDYFETLIKNEGITKTEYFGSYLPSEKPSIIEKCDILFNAYGNGSPLLLCALSNKLTDAAIYKKAVLNSPGTFMHEKLGICSYASDLNDASDLDGLYEWYMNLNAEEVGRHYCDLIQEIKETNSRAVHVVSEWLRQPR